jgi:hypothetical protein
MPTAAVDSIPIARSARRLAPVLWVLLALFVARVAGQALVAFPGVPWLLATFLILFARYQLREGGALACRPVI